MNKSELKQLIKEEIQKVLNENEFNTLNDIKLAIDKLPDGIGELEIQSDLSSFQVIPKSEPMRLIGEKRQRIF